MGMLTRKPSNHHQCSHKCKRTAMEMEMELELVQVVWAQALVLVH
jgi:hypothetical protein